MSTKQKKTAKTAARKTEAKAEVARASRARRPHAAARVKHVRAAAKASPGFAKRIWNSTPVRVLLGASAMALVVAKLKHLV